MFNVRTTVVLAVALVAATPVFATEIDEMTPEARIDRANGKKMVLLKGKDGKPVLIKQVWDHEGVESASTTERDAWAATRLFAKGKDVMTTLTRITGDKFAGVKYLHTEGGWSNTQGGTLLNGNRRKYECGGTAVGYIYVYE